LATVGENLRRLRERRGLHQNDLARDSGISQPTISILERDMRDPHTETLRKLADALGVPITALFAEDPEPQGPPPEPKTPVTMLSNEAFDKRLREAATEAIARALRNALDEEITALSVWHRGLVAHKAQPADVLLARHRLKTAKTRYTAAALLWAEFVAEADELREHPVERRVADAGAEETARKAAEERRKMEKHLANEAERQRVEEAGETA
jgi:transcriptional regulator with XRE-family HTH domain